MSDAKCKICRRHGEKLFLKGERCFSPKCAIVRKPYPPGVHGQKRRGRRDSSEYLTQMREKQKVRYLYGISEKQFSRYVAGALGKGGGDTVIKLNELLELRLDNVVFRLGFAVSRSIARQMVSHGHITVDGKQVFTPSYQVRVGQMVGLSPGHASSGAFQNLDITLKKHIPPSWLSLSAPKREGEIVSLPTGEDMVQSYNIKSIIEYYSR